MWISIDHRHEAMVVITNVVIIINYDLLARRNNPDNNASIFNKNVAQIIMPSGFFRHGSVMPSILQRGGQSGGRPPWSGSKGG